MKRNKPKQTNACRYGVSIPPPVIGPIVEEVCGGCHGSKNEVAHDIFGDYYHARCGCCGGRGTTRKDRDEPECRQCIKVDCLTCLFFLKLAQRRYEKFALCYRGSAPAVTGGCRD